MEPRIRKVVMKPMPLCNKCAKAITEPFGDIPGAHQFVGCADCPEIKDYNDAKAMCPVLKEGSNVACDMERR